MSFGIRRPLYRSVCSPQSKDISEQKPHTKNKCDAAKEHMHPWPVAILVTKGEAMHCNQARDNHCNPINEVSIHEILELSVSKDC